MSVVTNQMRISDLAEQLLHHKRVYYAGHPEVADAVYDALEEELRRLAPDHPVLNVVGGEVSVVETRRVEHSEPMLSLAKTYAEDELFTWAGDSAVVGTVKVDGNSLSIVYRNGRLDIAKTRGNGRVGEDVTEKIRWVSSIPSRLPESQGSLVAGILSENPEGFPAELEIRGELYCSESSFVKLSDEMQRLGLERPTSPRNIVAGLLGRKSHIDLSRFFGFFAFDFVQARAFGISSESEKFVWLKQHGFALPDHRLLRNKEDMKLYLDHVRELFEDGDLGLDGAVFTYDDLSLHDELGQTAHHPRYKMSFKWQGQTAISSIRDIVWQTSRLGVVTPVAVIEPVYLSGAKITNITLHNAAHVRAYNLKSGDRIELVRSGEVIPKFLRVVESTEGTFSWPSHCIECGEKLTADDVRLRCTNVESCPAQRAGVILNWIKCAEIDDLSEKRLAPLMEAGLVREVCDLYRLTPEDFLVIPQTREKMAAKLHANITNSRRIPLAQFLNGLGIQGAGLTTWEALLEHFPTLDAVRHLRTNQIIEIEGFADKSAQQIVSGLQARSDLIDSLLNAGVKPVDFARNPNESGTGGGHLSGKQLVITGTLSIPRADLEKMIKGAGGKLASAVSGNTFALVTSDPTGNSTKLKKARELGVRLWAEKDLMHAIEQGCE